MPSRIWLLVCLTVALPALSTPALSAAAVLESLQPNLVNHFTFDNPHSADPLSVVELDLGSDATNILLYNDAPRVADGAWWGSHFALETGQNNSTPNDDWKAGVMFPTSDTSTLDGTKHVTGITLMGWFKPLGTVSDNPSPNTNTPEPNDYYNSFGLAGFLRGDEGVGSLDGHAVRALLEVINGKVTGLGRRLDDQIGSGQRASSADWQDVMPPGIWTHLAATFDFNRGRISLYKNGAPLDSSDTSTGNWDITSGTDFTSNTSAGGIKIGGSYPDNSQEFNPFNGRIDELMFFNKTLSASEIAAQYELVSNIPGDFNLDGAVDAADYSVWRDGLGARYNAGDYTEWKTHFGISKQPGAGGGGIGSFSIPEPASLFYFLGGALLLGLSCKGRVKSSFFCAVLPTASRSARATLEL